MIILATERLHKFLNHSLECKLEVARISRVTQALLMSGIADSDAVIRRALDFFLRRQLPDGGWSGPEDTAWAISCSNSRKGHSALAIQSALQWLNDARKPNGGWGMYPRDQARIRTTALISTLVPEVCKGEDIAWLSSEWRKDFAGPVRLSYKASFFLLATPPGAADELVHRTISHLADDQNEDGGFAPWKGHPIGSDAWSTGVVLWGLSRWGEKVEPIVFERALEWLQKTQLPSGYWPYHYLDDGTSLALIGAVSAMKALAANK